MLKLSSLIIPAAVAVVLVGCGTAPADEPSAQPATPSATESESASASATPTPPVTPTTEPAEPGEPAIEPTPTTTPVDAMKTCYSGAPQTADGEAKYPTPGYEQRTIIEMAQGTTLTVAGDGYAPGIEVLVSFGPDRTDADFMNGLTAVAGPDGSYWCRIVLDPTWGVGDFTMMTGTLESNFEASKRYLGVKIVPAPPSQG